ncbi:MAG: PAS domain-containing protein, partial [Proteobacteria bacterium]|nr:PAS domain-containing protein [Pseudomonadota bacterium]
INNILKTAREGLRHELTVALHKAVMTKEIVLCPNLRVKTNGHYTLVNLTICLVAASSAKAQEEPLYMVILEEALALDKNQPLAAPDDSGEGHALCADSGARVEALKQELRVKEEYLQSTIEELETSNEELKSSNEEMQSLNEEAQSTNEELETSKEELQSINEELATVNNELQSKVADLSQANNDMRNLLAGTGIATVFVGHNLQILRFTPLATQIINLIPSDVGRPVAHTVSNLVGYDRMVADVQAVLDTLIPKELEVQTADGNWYSMRIRPYRTLENVIEGAVLTFSDITEMTKIRETLRKANELQRLAVVVRDAEDAITVQDLEGRILAWNPGAVRMYGWTEAEALTLNVHERIPESKRDNALKVLQQLAESKVLEPYRTQRLAKGGGVMEVWLTSTALVNETGELYAIATTERAAQATDGSADRGEK